MTSFIGQVFSSSGVSAIHDLGGTSIGYTMSYSNDYGSHLNIDAFDNFISFNNCDYKKKMKTNLKKIVKLGYISDYKFKKNLEDSKLLREKLKKKGVEYVIGFFDQGYFKDKLFGVGYHVSSFGYKFLLEKVIQNENIGLIIKPKKPKYL